MALAAHFLVSAQTLSECPADHEPEVAFVGRSNAGKSSALNRLTGSRRLARVSKTPGRTRLINFFAVAGGGRLVDLPGHGYANAPKATQERWSKAIDDYLRRRANLAAVVLIMDARRSFQPFDEGLLAWAQAAAKPLIILLNKCDKLPQGARLAAERATAARVADMDRTVAVPFSALTGLGADAAAAHIARFLQPTETDRA